MFFGKKSPPNIAWNLDTLQGGAIYYVFSCDRGLEIPLGHAVWIIAAAAAKLVYTVGKPDFTEYTMVALNSYGTAMLQSDVTETIKFIESFPEPLDDRTVGSTDHLSRTPIRFHYYIPKDGGSPRLDSRMANSAASYYDLLSCLRIIQRDTLKELQASIIANIPEVVIDDWMQRVMIIFGESLERLAAAYAQHPRLYREAAALTAIPVSVGAFAERTYNEMADGFTAAMLSHLESKAGFD